MTPKSQTLRVYTEAYPRLKQRRWPFTVFVSTDYIDKQFPNYMSWAQMREMQDVGATFGNHSTRHGYLIRRRAQESEEQWRQRVRHDIEHAQQRLDSAVEPKNISCSRRITHALDSTVLPKNTHLTIG